jgi:anti-sigma regulatory factor (Ser/Thr protein kinase)
MASADFDQKKIMEVQLAAEEVCTNIALYAYSGGDGLIRLAALAADGRLDLVIEDEGTPFDPSAAVATVPDAKVEDRPIGGL